MNLQIILGVLMLLDISLAYLVFVLYILRDLDKTFHGEVLNES